MRAVLRYGVPTVFFGLIVYLFFWPVDVDPAPWSPKPNPGFTGPFAANQALEAVERIGQGVAEGPEDVDVDAQGRIYGGFRDGRILRFSPDGKSHEVFATTGGRPLGMDFDAAGNLYVADAMKGLLVITPDGKVEVVSTSSDGVPFKFADDVDVGADGLVYFSDASFKFDLPNYAKDILEARPNGRLLVYDPTSKQTKTLAEGLYFANGVAVSPDASFVLVVETSRYTVRKVWLTGEKAGQSEVAIDNLPAFPDGISSNDRGTYWLALASPRQSAVDMLMPYAFLHSVVVRLPLWIQPAPERYGFFLGLDGNGKVLHNFQDPRPVSFSPVTSVEEDNGMLYLGSLEHDAIGRIKAP